MYLSIYLSMCLSVYICIYVCRNNWFKLTLSRNKLNCSINNYLHTSNDNTKCNFMCYKTVKTNLIQAK